MYNILHFIHFFNLVPSIWLPHVNTIGESRFESKEYNLITHSKPYIVNQLIQNNFTVFLTDVDVAWLSPNIVFYINYTASIKDFIYAVDGPNDGAVNMGFYVVRPTKETKKIFNAITELQKTEKGNDQDVANRFFHLNMDLLWRHGHSLDKLLFTDGEIYFHHKMNKKLGIQPMTFHANYFIGFDSKKKVLVQEGMWFL